jgi:centriolar protein POC1
MKLLKRNQAHQLPLYAITKNEHLIFTAGQDKVITTWDIKSLTQNKLSINTGKSIYSLCYIPIFNYLAIGTSLGNLHIIDLNIKQEIKNFVQHKKGIFDIKFHSKSETLICASEDESISLWNINTLELIRVIPLKSGSIRKLDLKDDILIAVTNQGFIHEFECDFFNEISTKHINDCGLMSVCYHPTKKNVVICGDKDGFLYFLNREENSFRIILKSPAHKGRIYDIKSTNNKIFTASRDRHIKVWDAETLDFLDKSALSKDGNFRSINSLETYKKTLVSVGDDTGVLFWQI